jgi:hypothetical protein
MAAAPICITCNAERELISIKPTRNRHDLLQYECPKCRNVFRLVMQRTPVEAEDDLTFDLPPLQARTA